MTKIAERQERWLMTEVTLSMEKVFRDQHRSAASDQ